MAIKTDAELWERVWKLEALANRTNYPAEARVARRKARQLRKALGVEPIRVDTRRAADVYREPEPSPEEEHEWPWDWSWWVVEDPMSRGPFG